MAEISSRRFVAVVTFACVVTFGGVVGWDRLTAPTSAVASSASSRIVRSFSICSGSDRYTCVVDGDTIWLDGEKIRIADIDTPEVGEPQCESELALGRKATSRLRQLLSDRAFELQGWQGRDEDKYGRKLRVLIRDGRSIGDVLVSEGLARTWSGRREPWC